MNKIIVLVAIVASINTVLSSESESKFIADLMKPFRGLNYRRTDRSRDDGSEIFEAVKNVETNNEPASPPENDSENVEAVKNVETINEPASPNESNSEIVGTVKDLVTNNEPDSPPENNSEIIEAVNSELINNEPGSPSDEKKISERVVYTSGNFPADEYPNSDLIVYAPNVDFVGFDLYKIEAVTDAFQCGSQFCAGDIKCTHFVYRKSDSHCWLKSRYASGSKWAAPQSELISGLIPHRACDVNKATVSSLLSCLSLGGL